MEDRSLTRDFLFSVAPDYELNGLNHPTCSQSATCLKRNAISIPHMTRPMPMTRLIERTLHLIHFLIFTGTDLVAPN